MTTEQEPFSYFNRTVTGQEYSDASITDTYGAYEELQPVEITELPQWSEPSYSEPAPMPERRSEPKTPSWSYNENPLFAAMPADVQARMEYEPTTFYDTLANQSASDRLVHRIQEDTAEMPTNYSVYHQLRAEWSVDSAASDSAGSPELMTQALRAVEAAPLPPQASEPERIIAAADLPVSDVAFHPPVPLWHAPLRTSNQNVGLEPQFMRGPLPDTLTPRLETQHSIAPTVKEVHAPIIETVAQQLETAAPTNNPQGLTPDANLAFLSRITQSGETQNHQSDNEATQVISKAELAGTVTEGQKIPDGQELTAHVAVEETISALETKPPKTIRSYGHALLVAAGLTFRMKRDAATQSYYGELVDSKGIVHIDNINLAENAEGERMRTTRRLLGHMSRLGIRIPKLPEPRIV